MTIRLVYLSFNSISRPNENIYMFRVTRPYLNSLVKPRIVFRISEKKYNFMHFKRRNAFFKMHKIYFLDRKTRYPKHTYVLFGLTMYAFDFEQYYTLENISIESSFKVVFISFRSYRAQPLRRRVPKFYLWKLYNLCYTRTYRGLTV